MRPARTLVLMNAFAWTFGAGAMSASASNSGIYPPHVQPPSPVPCKPPRSVTPPLIGPDGNPIVHSIGSSPVIQYECPNYPLVASADLTGGSFAINGKGLAVSFNLINTTTTQSASYVYPIAVQVHAVIAFDVYKAVSCGGGLEQWVFQRHQSLPFDSSLLTVAEKPFHISAVVAGGLLGLSDGEAITHVSTHYEIKAPTDAAFIHFQKLYSADFPQTMTFTPEDGQCHDPVLAKALVSTVVNMDTQRILAGAAVGLVRGSESDLFYYGKSDVAASKVPDAGTLFEIGSVTKTFTATLLARYASDPELAAAQIHLSDPIGAYLPKAYALPSGSKKLLITATELANYTSGLPRDLPFPNTPGELFSEFDNVGLLSDPGTTPLYSNFGFALLGRAIESRVGQSWEDLVRSQITEPLGMSDTEVLYDEKGIQRLSAEQATRLATAYDCTSGDPCVPFSMEEPFNEVLSPAGGLYSSAPDILKWLRFNMGLDAQAPAGLKGALPALFSGAGLAWNISAPGKPSAVISKNGGYRGFSSDVVFRPQTGTGAFILSNTTNGVDPLCFSILFNIPAVPAIMGPPIQL